MKSHCSARQVGRTPTSAPDPQVRPCRAGKFLYSPPATDALGRSGSPSPPASSMPERRQPQPKNNSRRVSQRIARTHTVQNRGQHLPPARLISTPMKIPAANSFMVRLRTDASILPRRAPNAMRMPISRARRATPYDIRANSPVAAGAIATIPKTPSTMATARAGNRGSASCSFRPPTSYTVSSGSRSRMARRNNSAARRRQGAARHHRGLTRAVLVHREKRRRFGIFAERFIFSRL